MTAKEFRYPVLNPKDVPVFDSCRNGTRIRAERFDEPGDESPTEASITDPTVRHRNRASVLTADTNGDWSWKPYRDRVLGDQIQTFKGVPASTAELFRREAFPDTRGAKLFGVPEHMKDESAVDFQERCKAAHKTAGDYVYHAATAA